MSRVSLLGVVLLLTAFLLALGMVSTAPALAAGEYKLVAEWGKQGQGKGEFSYPTSVAVYGNYVYVADTGNNRIEKFDLDGHYLDGWYSYLTFGGTYYLQAPQGLCVDENGNVWVSDTQDYRVVEFAPDGTYRTFWGRYGTGPGEFRQIHGLASDEGLVYVVDCFNNRIEVFNRRGVYQWGWGTFGAGEGQFDFPVGQIALGPEWNGHVQMTDVYVADTYNNRIEKSDRRGEFLAAWGAGEGPFNRPYGVAIDSRRNAVCVGDTGNQRIVMLTTDGDFVTSWGSAGSGPGQFGWPCAVAVDAKGYVYVCDSTNHRIEKFEPIKPCLALIAPTYSTDESTKPTFGISWEGWGSDGTEMASYVLYQSTNSASGPWTRIGAYTTARGSKPIAGRPGHTYYFRLNGTDKRNEKSMRFASTVVPRDQTSMSFSGRWATPTAGKGTYYLGSERRSNVHGNSATYRFTKAQGVGLIVTQRPSGGYAQVFIDNVAVATVNCYATQTRYRVPVVVKNFGTPTSGTLKVVVSGSHQTGSTGDYVELDGVAARR